MKNGKENLGTILIILIIAVALITVSYALITSNKNLVNNSSNTNAANYNLNQNESSNLTDKEKDEMNIDEDTAKKLKESSKPKETEIANYTSTLYDRDQNRVDNISLAVSKINGTIIKKGEEFSFNNTVGPMDEEHGFKKAVGFDSEGRKIEVAGGGMCQISSTIYNAALIANLEITERHPHSRRVYYVPKDKDATIYYGSLDLKFINNTENDIRMDATTDGQNVTIKLIKLEYENKELAR